MKLQICDNALVLFQGDSVTDAGRSRENDNELGCGYASTIAAMFSAMHPEKKVRFVNRGISGNRVTDLLGRWQEDCVNLKPDWVSILIGINNTWRRYDSNNPTTTKDFEKQLRELLEKTRKNTKAQIILCEPFVLPVPADRLTWREDLDPKINVTRNLAIEFNTLLVPLDGIFAQAATLREPGFWAGDGVHPSPAGHALIAKSWLQTVGAW
jgi:lysophospholipase L1-like esterase